MRERLEKSGENEREEGIGYEIRRGRRRRRGTSAEADEPWRASEEREKLRKDRTKKEEEVTT